MFRDFKDSEIKVINKSMIQSNRKDAIAVGDTTYHTGNLCRNGHDAERRVHNGACIECSKIRNRRNSNKIRKTSKYREYQRRYQAKYRHTARGRECISNAQQKYIDKKKAEADEIDQARS